VRFRLEQRFSADPDTVAEAYTDPALYQRLAEAATLGRPEFLQRTGDGEQVETRVRYRFCGNLSSAARKVVDPAKLSWVEESAHDLAERRVSFRMIPDNYADRFRSAGSYLFHSDGDGTLRVAEGELSVRVPLVGGTVEKAIVSGLADHLRGEIAVVERFLADGGR
jgi:hypothetical protein